MPKETMPAHINDTKEIFRASEGVFNQYYAAQVYSVFSMPRGFLEVAYETLSSSRAQYTKEYYSQQLYGTHIDYDPHICVLANFSLTACAVSSRSVNAADTQAPFKADKPISCRKVEEMRLNM